MFKKLFFLFILMLLAVNANADANASRRVNTATATQDTSTNIAVGGTQITCTKAMPINSVSTSDPIGVMYKATGSSISLKIHAEQGFDVPNPEGTPDSAYLIVETLETALTDTAWHMATIDSVVGTYLRFNIEGNSGNGAGNSVQIKVIK